MPSEVLVRVLQNCLDLSLEGRQIIRYRIPNLFHVDAKILVDQHIPHRDNIVPGNIRILLLQGWGNPAGGLSNNLNMMNGPHLKEFVLEKSCAVRRKPPLDILDRLHYIQELFPIHSQTGTASCSTRSLTLGRSPRSLATSTLQPSRSSSSRTRAA